MPHPFEEEEDDINKYGYNNDNNNTNNSSNNANNNNSSGNTNERTMMRGSSNNNHSREISVRDQEISRLQNHVNALSNKLESVMQENNNNRNNNQAQAQRSSSKNGGKRTNLMSPHAVHIQQVDADIPGVKRSVIRAGRERIGRQASICTQRVMASLPSSDGDRYGSHPVAIRILDMFQRPNAHVDYLNSEQFAKDLFKLCHKVRSTLEHEPRVVFIQSPCYIFGDIHGNLEDLHFFSDNIWRLGMSLTAGNFLFLGDYVDRGMSCLEVIAYLLSMKLQNPQKVFLLRGNHETRDVNGWEEHYGERSFIWQCRNRFGDDVGYRIWEACNQVFDRLPLVAVVDQDIFCVHGGIPRPISYTNPSSTTTRIQDILNVPRVAGINPPYEHEDDAYQQVASDCIWSDPASEDQEMNSVDPTTGYGESLRGGGAICFGNKAITDFLQEQGFSYIMRAHEAHAEGVAVSKGARVFTVFSTSRDHNQGSHALAGCILVDDERLQVVNRSPAYKNQYIHRRDSLSLQSLSHLEIAKRIKLGLVTPGDDDDDDDDDENWDDENWDDSSSDDEAVDNNNNNANTVDMGQQQQQQQQQQQEQSRPVFAQGRRSSIDLSLISDNIHDSAMELSASSSSMISTNFDGSGSGRNLGGLGGSGRNLKESLQYAGGIMTEGVTEEEVDDGDEDSTVNGDDLDESMAK